MNLAPPEGPASNGALVQATDKSGVAERGILIGRGQLLWNLAVI